MPSGSDQGTVHCTALLACLNNPFSLAATVGNSGRINVDYVERTGKIVWAVYMHNPAARGAAATRSPGTRARCATSYMGASIRRT